MGPALQLLQQGLEAVRAVDTTTLTATELGSGLLGLQKIIDGLNVEHAKLMTEADKAGVHAGSGHRNIASWLAANGNTSYVRAKKQHQLGDARTSHPNSKTPSATGPCHPTPRPSCCRRWVRIIPATSAN